MSGRPPHPVVAHLRDNSVASLEAVGIYARWSTTNPRKLSLNYNQYEAEDGHPLVDRCRGLVLRQDHDGERGGPGAYTVLAHPFSRFYNLGTAQAAPLDWETATFEEKLDGTLCIVYFDPDLDAWSVATRSVPDADVPTPTGETFAQMFARVARGVLLPDRRLTYCYELTGPGNQIVIPYDEWRVTLLAAFTAEGLEAPGHNLAPVCAFTDLDRARAWLAEQPGHLAEGFVVRDAVGRRVKIKSAQYAAIAKATSTASTDGGLLGILLGGSADDVAPLLPAERRDRLETIRSGLRAFTERIEGFAANLPPSDRKTAAMAVLASPFARWIGVVLDLWPHGARRLARFSDHIEAERKKTAGVVGGALLDRLLADVVSP